MAYEIENNSTGLLTVNSSGGNLVGTIPAGVCAHAVCIGTTLTTAADWDWDYISTTTITGTGANVLGTSPTITTPTISSLSSASATNLTLQSAGTTAMTIDTSQNVGIGTAGPTAKLDISNGGIKVSTGGYNLTMQGSASSGTLNGLFIAGVPRVTDDTGTFENTYIGCGASVGNIIFQQGSSSTTSSNTERMRITSAGVVQVGNNAGTGEVFAQNTVKVWGVLTSSGTLYNSFGVSSSSKVSTGVYSISFTRTFGSSRFGSGLSQYSNGFQFINTESTTGCRVNTQNSIGTNTDADCQFLIAGGS